MELPIRPNRRLPKALWLVSFHMICRPSAKLPHRVKISHV